MSAASAPGDPLHPHRADRLRVLALLGGVVVLFLGAQWLLRDSPYATRALVDATWTLAPAWAMGRAIRSARQSSEDASAWRWIAAGLACHVASMISWDVDELLLGNVSPFPTASDWLSMLASIVSTVGLVRFRPARERQPSFTRKRIGDFGVLVCTAASICTVLFYAPATQRADLTSDALVTALAYPVVNTACVTYALLQLGGLPRGRRARIVRLLFLALAWTGLVATLFAVQLLMGGYQLGSLDVIFFVPALITIYATHEDDWRAVAPRDEEDEAAGVQAVDLLVTPVCIGAASLVATTHPENFHTVTWIVVTVAGVLTAGFVALREWGILGIERSLRLDVEETARRTRRLLDSVPLGIARLDREGNVVDANERFATRLGPGSARLSDRSWDAVGLGPIVRRALETWQRVATDQPLVVDGRAYRVTVAPGEDGAIVVVDDVTAERRLEHEVMRAQTMLAVGTLAGGIAHDFNNLLSGMIATASLLKRRLGDRTDVSELLDHLEQSTWRGAELTAQLLSLARRRDAVRTTVDVLPIVQRVVTLLGRSVDGTIVVRGDVPSGRLAIEGDAGQLEQALLNLGINARDAMRPRGGELRFDVEVEGEGDARIAAIRVSDTGSGIAPEVRDRIFEPFYTTKAPDEGTGLGLSMVYAFARDHGGSIDFDTEVGRGTRFTLRLPVSELDVPIAPEPRTDLPRGTETILVVDDRESARYALTILLGECGYTVLTATSGQEALATVEERGDEIDLIITDALMRQMGGRELLRRLRELGVRTEVILATGHDDEIRFGYDGFATMLRKPFDPAKTARAVRKVLDRRGLGASRPTPAPTTHRPN